jgi:hypothetical protein
MKKKHYQPINQLEVEVHKAGVVYEPLSHITVRSERLRGIYFFILLSFVLCHLFYLFRINNIYILLILTFHVVNILFSNNIKSMTMSVLPFDKRSNCLFSIRVSNVFVFHVFYIDIRPSCFIRIFHISVSFISRNLYVFCPCPCNENFPHF